MKDLLVLLGNRVRELRAARKWSQEEFAHVSGLHRTYIGQIERGEKNISFDNLSKLSAVLGVTLSELLSGLETAGKLDVESTRRAESAGRNTHGSRMLEIQKAVKRLDIQRAALDKTIGRLQELASSGVGTVKGPRRRTSRV